MAYALSAMQICGIFFSTSQTAQNLPVAQTVERHQCHGFDCQGMHALNKTLRISNANNDACLSKDAVTFTFVSANFPE